MYLSVSMNTLQWTDVCVQIVYRAPGEDEKLTLYIQAVHKDQQISWITEMKKGLHVLLTYCCYCDLTSR